MSITVSVGMISGKTATVQVELDEEVNTLRLRAQSALGIGKGWLLDSAGQALDTGSKIADANIQSGDTLSFVTARLGWLLDSAGQALDTGSKIADANIQSGDTLSFVTARLQLQARGTAMAAILGDGSVVTWGRAKSGGDSRTVRDQLKNVKHIQATHGAFAAIIADGSVVTWGSVERAFAAILADGFVVTWGDAERGGESSAVEDQLITVQQIQASCCASLPFLVIDPW
eukprot:s899_g6.t1